MKEILDIIRVQRHDFLNHLQVISGLLQLNKPDKALDYIKQICYEAGQESHICRIDNSELAIRLLREQHMATKRGIELEIVVLDFSDTDLPDNLVTEIIGKLLPFALEQCKEKGDYCQLRLRGNELCGMIELEFPDGAEVAKTFLSDIDHDLSKYGVQVNLLVEEGQCQLCLQIPKIKTCVAG